MLTELQMRGDETTRSSQHGTFTGDPKDLTIVSASTRDGLVWLLNGRSASVRLQVAGKEAKRFQALCTTWCHHQRVAAARVPESSD